MTQQTQTQAVQAAQPQNQQVQQGQNKSKALTPKQMASNYVGQMTAEWAKVLPSICTPERFARVALSCLNGNPKLAQALATDSGKLSLSQSFMKCAEVGLEPNGRDAHLIPYNTKNGPMIQLILDYKGIVQLCRRSGEIANIVAEVVKEKDEFSYEDGVIHHKIDFRLPSRGQSFAWYVKVYFKDGTIQSKVMNREDIERIRARSRSKDDGPWVTDYDSMALKGLAVDTPILTTEGWKTMGDLKKGDMVFDMNGEPTPIIAVSEVKHLPCYKITTSNSEEIICDNEHRWLGWIGWNRRNKPWKELTTMELLAAKNDKKTVAIPVAKPLDTGHIEKMPKGIAYLLGYWIGNGTSRGATVTCHKDDIEHIKNMINASCYSLGAIRPEPRSKAACISITKGFKEYLIKNNQLGNKHIPDDVLLWHPQDKQDFLAGLIDSDGTINKERGRVIFNSTKKAIAYGVYSLIYSLGEVACIHEQVCHGYGKTVLCYYVSFKPSETLKPAYLERKLQNLRPRQVKLYRSIRSIEEVESVPTKCIAVASETHSYLAGKTLIPTHNTVFKQLSKWLPMAYEPLSKAIQYDNEDERDPELINVTPKSRFDAPANAPQGGLLAALSGQPQQAGQPAEVANAPQEQPVEQPAGQNEAQAAMADHVKAETAIKLHLKNTKAPVGFADLKAWYELEFGDWNAQDALSHIDHYVGKAFDWKNNQ